MVPRRLCLLVLAALVSFPAPPSAQNLPAHVDPAAREDMVDPAMVPALRFLTTDDFPPFNYSDGSGRLVGFNIDLANAICMRLSARCTVQAWPWNRVQEALANNQGDALIAGLSMDGQAAERFDFSRIYLQLPARFVTRRGVEMVFDPAGFAGSVGAREGSAQARLIARVLPEAQISPYETEFDALAALREGEVDVVFGDGMRLAFWLNDNPDCCAFSGNAYFRPDLFGQGMTIAVPAGLDNVRTAINWALVRLEREGRLNELYLRWFPVSFY
ncbi:transporter substrate-binding domain-containing protein [Pelagibacterium limicola]|uniref:transporter substrate-binding domain-containing protein n=1 Tax=Pelagibacterium limicola TaxID=2791022 RepID=UPI0018AF9152|nr:transporter substrate-binding domain-containing protein [Pelagibacterium limicola]